MHIISTSIIGAYFIIRGINAFTTEYTNEFLILNDIEEDRYNYVSYASYLSMVAVLILALIAIVSQYLINDVKNFKEEYGLNYKRYSYRSPSFSGDDPSQYQEEEKGEADEESEINISLKLETKGKPNYMSFETD